MIELLAPVGSRESLIAAVEGGADAVYFAGKSFGARAFAANFEEAEMREAIEFAHQRNVLVDVTVNTIVDDCEFGELADYLRFLYEAGADAIIVQDMGVAKLAKEIVPDLPLHASTQMTVHNIEGVRMLKELGFARVVLSRELSMAEIKEICENVDVEIETFIHGALCVCYSGQCLMSGMIGGRSGNRGKCAQPCRLPYTLVDENDKDMLENVDAGHYLLSPKDMNTVEMIPEFIEAGVASLKIEGRMKRPEYVAVVVDTYRRAIDRYIAEKTEFRVSEQEQKELAQIFNRDFTTAYLKRRPGRLMISDRRPNNRGVMAGRVTKVDVPNKLVTMKLSEAVNVGDIVEFWVKVGGRVSATIQEMTCNGTAVEAAKKGQEITFAVPSLVHVNDRVFKVFDAKLMAKARQFFQNGAPVRRFPVNVEVRAGIGEPLCITITDEDGVQGVGVTEFIGEAARKRPLNEETIMKQISRLGATVYELEKLECIIDGDVMVPMSEINEARRQAVEMLDELRNEKFDRNPLPDNCQNNWQQRLRVTSNVKKVTPLVGVAVDSLSKANAALDNGADILYFGGENFEHKAITADDYQRACAMAGRNGCKVYFETPRIVRKPQLAEMKKLLQSFKNAAIDGIVIQNIAMAKMVRDILPEMPLHAGAYLNLYNNLAIDYWQELGAASAVLSPELNMGQIEHIAQRSRDVELECIVQGNLTLMVSEYCVLGSFLGGLDKGQCSGACTKGTYYLLDRKNERFPIVTDQFCHMHLLNGKEMSMLPHVQKLSEIGIKRLRIEGRYMNEKRLGQVTKLYKEFAVLGNQHPLMMNDKMAAVEGNNITRGHYFRGVL